MLNYTLIAYQEGYSYSDRCGDRYSHDGSQTIHYSTDSQEIINLWASYLCKNADGLDDAEQEYEITLLFNGKPYEEYDSPESEEMEALYDRIHAAVLVAVDIHVAEKNRQRELEAKAKRAREEQLRLKAQRDREAEERAQYESLRKKYGGA